MNMRLDLAPNVYFVATLRSIGSTDEEMEALGGPEKQPNELEMLRFRELCGLLNEAAYRLHFMEPMGSA